MIKPTYTNLFLIVFAVVFSVLAAATGTVWLIFNVGLWTALLSFPLLVSVAVVFAAWMDEKL